MTLSEFKAWFEGFTEDMDGPPSEKQWKRVKKRVGEISGFALTERMFVDRFVPSHPWRRYHEPLISYGGGNLSATSCSSNSSGGGVRADEFDGHSAMLSLGKADAAEMAA